MSRLSSPSEPPTPSASTEAVEDRLRRLEKALDTMQVGVAIVDTDRRILYVNRAEAEMHGYTKEAI